MAPAYDDDNGARSWVGVGRRRAVLLAGGGLGNAVLFSISDIVIWTVDLLPGAEAIGSINSSMQCMMKSACAQCLCRHEDPETGEESFVYSCNNQDQVLDEVDFSNLRQRLRQNSVQEKLSDLWLDHLLEEYRQH